METIVSLFLIPVLIPMLVKHWRERKMFSRENTCVRIPGDRAIQCNYASMQCNYASMQCNYALHNAMQLCNATMQCDYAQCNYAI